MFVLTLTDDDIEPGTEVDQQYGNTALESFWRTNNFFNRKSTQIFILVALQH